MRPLCLGASWSVRATSMHHLAWWASVVQTFWPVTTQRRRRLHGPGLQRRQVRARLGLGEALAPDLLGGEDRRQVALLLLLGPVGDHGRAAHREAEHVGRLRAPRAHDLLVEDRLLDQRRAAAAVLLRPRHAGPAAVVELALPVEAERRSPSSSPSGSRARVVVPRARRAARRGRPPPRAKGSGPRRRGSYRRPSLDADAHRALPRLLALVLARGAGRARACSPTSSGSTRSGSPRRGARTRSRCSACSPARPSGSALGLRAHADPRAPADGDRDGRRDARRALAAGASGSGSACRARRSPRAGTACRSRAPLRRTREYVEIVRRGARARGRLELRRPGVDAAAAGDGPRQAAEAARQAGAGADPDLPRRDRPEGRRADRRDRRRLAAVPARPRASPRCCWSRCARGLEPAGRRSRTSTSPPRRAGRGRTRTSTRRATRCARGWRSTSARWARRRRTSTSSSPTATATATPRARCRTRSWPATASGAAAALTDELIDAACDRHARPAGCDERLGGLRAAPARRRCVAVPCGDRTRPPSCARSPRPRAPRLRD